MSKREVKIYCPKCSWEPRPESRWFCGTCSHAWNTFETGGNCPECGHRHDETQCLSCHVHSPHADWYHEFNHDEIEEWVTEVIGTEFFSRSGMAEPT